MIIGVSGKIGSGKDEVFSAIKELSPGLGWENKKYAAKLKAITGLLLGVDPEMFEDRTYKESTLGPEWWCYDIPGKGLRPRGYFQDRADNEMCEERYLVKLTPRAILQKLGTEGGRQAIHPNIWINALFADYMYGHSYWVVTDVRFPNEVEAIQEKGGIVIRINRPGHEDTGDHPSETALDNFWGFDKIITNDGSIEDLWFEVRKILQDENIPVI